MSSLFAHFRDTRGKYGTFYALSRLRNFVIASLRLLVLTPQISLHNRALGEAEDLPRGKRIFVVGNGPSLNKLPLHLLEDEDVFVSNNFHLMFPRISWRPRFMAVSDAYVLTESRDNVLANAKSYERVYVPAVHASNVNSFRLYRQLDNSYFFNVLPILASGNLDYVPINKTVTNFMLGIASRLGYAEVFFIGMDLSYPSVKEYDQTKRVIQSQRADPDHFSPDYFGKGKHFHAPEVDEMREQIRATVQRLTDIRFLNVGVGGRLDFVERSALRSALAIDQQTEIALLRRHLLYRLTLVMPDANVKELAGEIIQKLVDSSSSASAAPISLTGFSFSPTGSDSETSRGEIIAIDALGFDIWTHS
jgi:uncharacterized Rossmann fold enzyme